MLKAIVVAAMLAAASMQVKAQLHEELIPRSYPEDCKYYLVKSKQTGKLLHKQVCPKNDYYSGISFTLTEVNCKRKEFREIGYGEDLIKNIKNHPSHTWKWEKTVKGSSRSDLVNFVCKRG